MRLRALILACTIGTAFAQTTPSISTKQIQQPIFEVNLAPVTQANLRLVGNPGPQTYYYWIVTNYLLGATSPVFVGQMNTAPNTLSSTNYIQVTPNYLPGISSVDLLRTTTPTPPSGGCNCAVATAVSSGNINDQSNSLSSYTINPVDPNKFVTTITNEVVGAGETHALLRQNGLLVCDLSTGCGSGSTLPTPPSSSLCFISTGTASVDWNWFSCPSLPTGVAKGSALVSNGVAQVGVYQMKPQFDVRDFGVTGGGTDGTAGVQAAVNAACTSGVPGATVIVPNNFFIEITSTIIFSHCAGIIFDGGASQGQGTLTGGGAASFNWCGGVSAAPVFEVNQTRDSIFRNFTIVTNGCTEDVGNGAAIGILIDEIAPNTQIVTNNKFEDIQIYNGAGQSSTFIGVSVCPTTTGGNCEQQNFDRLIIQCSAAYPDPITATNSGIGVRWGNASPPDTSEPYQEDMRWIDINDCSRAIDIEGGTGTNVLTIDGGLMEGNYTDLYLNAGRNTHYEHFRSEFAASPIVIGNPSSSPAHDLTLEENSFSGLSAAVGPSICYSYPDTGGILRFIKNDWDNLNSVAPFGPCTGSGGGFFGSVDSQDNNYPNNGSHCLASAFATSGELVSINDQPAGGACDYGGLRMIGANEVFQNYPNTFINLPACSAVTNGSIKAITDSTVTNLGSIVSAGGGSNQVWLQCDGTNYRVFANSAPLAWNSPVAATDNALFANQNYSTTFTQASPVPWTWSNATNAVGSGVSPPRPGVFNAVSVGGSGCATTSCAMPLAISGGTSVLIFTSDQAGSRSAPTDDGSNIYTLLTSTQLSSWTSAVWYCISCNAATTVTYATNAINSMSGGTFTGVSAIGANHYSSQTAGNVVSDTLTTTGTNSLIVAVANMDTATTFIPMSGTLQYFTPNSVNMAQGVLTTPTYTSPGVSYTSSGNWVTTNLYWQMRSVELLGIGGSIVNQSSPILGLCGQFWTGVASAPDCWTEEVLLGTGANPSSTLVFGHSFTTNLLTVQVPALVIKSLANGCLFVSSSQVESTGSACGSGGGSFVINVNGAGSLGSTAIRQS